MKVCENHVPHSHVKKTVTSTSNSISLHDERGQKKDIVDFVRSVVYSDKKIRRWREEDKHVVIETLSDKADGM
jgi:hypothetical protein